MFLNLQQRLLRIVTGLGRRASRRSRRLELRGGPAAKLQTGHIDSLELLKLVRESGPPIRTVYDLGANVGTWTLLAKTLFPAAEVEAFEPLAAHAEQFLAAVADLRAVRLHQVALGPSEGTARLNVTSFSDAASLLEITSAGAEDFGVTGGETVNVPVVPLDDWAMTHRLPWPDLIKLDLQGYEIEALKGAPRCLKNARWILCEVSFREYYGGQPLFAEVTAFLAAAGFRLRALPAFGSGLIHQQTDALFEAVREDSAAAR